MGIYSEHWEKYKKQSLNWLVRLGLLVVIGLPALVLAALAVGRVTGNSPAYFQLGLLAVWLIAFTWTALLSSRVVCPRCNTQYSRGKGLSNCPHCGLRMLQDEP